MFVCVSANISSCVKIGVELKVIQKDGECDRGAQPHLNLTIPLQSKQTLTCPDLNTLTLPNSTHSVSWYHVSLCVCVNKHLRTIIIKYDTENSSNCYEANEFLNLQSHTANGLRRRELKQSASFSLKVVREAKL